MTHRIHPAWWPVLALTVPVWAPLLAVRNRRFRRSAELAARRNSERLEAARPLELPEVDKLEITVLVDERADPGFHGEEGVSYLLRTELGAVLMDVAFGPATPTFAHNARLLGFSWDEVDGLAVSHLHGDHMGGLGAARAGKVALPEELLPEREDLPCFLPEPAQAPGFRPVVVDGPRLLTAGIGTTGPLSRSLFFMGLVEEQSLLVRVRGHGLVVVTGCGHPGVDLILDMAGRLAPGPIHTVAGGLHFPITSGRGRYAGIQAQMLLGTGRPPWRGVTDEDLTRAVDRLRVAKVRRALLSAHDTCDHALARFADELDADVEILRAGGTWTL
jgi:7,8-dihydropterin-6-yl-methyl-4-(beta-D-ribofuranosyl)aminobenzene 5'-phosphate synthase